MLAAMMQLEAPERDVPADRTVLRLPPAALLVVAGVPGAGKTLLSRIDAPGSLILDPEPFRDRYRQLLGPLPYRLWRPLVHGEHFLRILLALPGPTGLIVHDTGTRDWRRRLLISLARRCGRTGHLLLLDVTAKAALVGQQRRRRTLRRSAFAATGTTSASSAPSFPPQAARTPTPPACWPRVGPPSASWPVQPPTA